MKRLTACFLAVFLMCSAALAQEGATPLIWRVTDGQGHELYLFGTIHVAEESAYPLPAAVTDAFEACDALALELDITTAALQILLTPGYADAMFLAHEDSIDAHLSPETAAALRRFMEERGIPRAAYEKMSPMAAYSMVEEYVSEDSGLTADQGVDNYLAQRARERNMPILEIESAQFQFGLLAGFSDELYDMMIFSMTEYPQASARQTRGMYDAWRTGNSSLLAFYCAADTWGADPAEREMMENFEKRMLTDRNVGMADFAEEKLKSGETVFLAVGAGHMIGTRGVVALMRSRGYKVEEIGR